MEKRYLTPTVETLNVGVETAILSLSHGEGVQGDPGLLPGLGGSPAFRPGSAVVNAD